MLRGVVRANSAGDKAPQLRELPAHGGPGSRRCFTSRDYSDVEPKRGLFALPAPRPLFDTVLAFVEETASELKLA